MRGWYGNVEFWSTISRIHGRAALSLFCINTSLCRFSFQGKLIYSLTDSHVQHLDSLCRICEDKIKDHKHKVDTNRLVSEIHQIWKEI